MVKIILRQTEEKNVEGMRKILSSIKLALI